MLSEILDLELQHPLVMKLSFNVEKTTTVGRDPMCACFLPRDPSVRKKITFTLTKVRHFCLAVVTYKPADGAIAPSYNYQLLR